MPISVVVMVINVRRSMQVELSLPQTFYTSSRRSGLYGSKLTCIPIVEWKNAIVLLGSEEDDPVRLAWRHIQ